mmetsp:Transcript_38160/g.105162  ORF Transcript_38160/g.105162 Transcript_38160/m.105162 type:complete len:589 (+) Transcript_38160:94-1860(+)|eukprot:CAMPEP_0117478272 /NCGR_PEP_ID=MMETSP0784-20121206/11259_1 /TAXON_ID=39447 /ORGANISM="" /LENGTH=588 /DNA_ID=CAMNT_0005272613 /DNA_START=22 /DNA_END=1788 /DNA_ORIENTATION=-
MAGPCEAHLWRDPQSGIVVRNTFIDVCPLDEDSNSDESSPCWSPQRRNASAPPSPYRKRNQEYIGFSDEEEEEEDPGSIPSYTWAAGGGLLSLDGREVGFKPPQELTEPSWLHAVSPLVKGGLGYVPSPLFNTQGLVPSLAAATAFGTPSRVPSRVPSLGGPGPRLGLGLDKFRNPEMSHPSEMHHGAAYVSETPPLPNGGFGHDDPAEAPAYIMSPECGAGSGGLPGQDASRRPRQEAGQRSAPAGPHGQPLMPMELVDPSPVAGWPTFYGSHAAAGARMPYLMDPGRLAVHGGDAGDRRVEGGFLDSAAYAYPGNMPGYALQGVGAGGLVAAEMPGHTLPGNYGGDYYGGKAPARESANHGEDHGLRGNNARKGAGRGGKGGVGQRGGEGKTSQNEKGSSAPPCGLWVAPGAMNGTNCGGDVKGDDTPKAGEVKGVKVPLSGGGPKRTDYVKKYGGQGEDQQVNNSKAPITTMMLKNIPCRKSQEEVMAHIDGKGFTDRYDFFYLPRDVKFRANLGYAFINFLTAEDAKNFENEMQGYRFTGSGSTKACAVVPAHVQGLMNNLSAFKRTEVMRSSRKPYFSGFVAS